jgi:hypothetical protein
MQCEVQHYHITVSWSVVRHVALVARHCITRQPLCSQTMFLEQTKPNIEAANHTMINMCRPVSGGITAVALHFQRTTAPGVR